MPTGQIMHRDIFRRKISPSGHLALQNIKKCQLFPSVLIDRGLNRIFISM
jgi:hypothetical protein